jgi:hypothetical protein
MMESFALGLCSFDAVSPIYLWAFQKNAVIIIVIVIVTIIVMP